MIRKRNMKDNSQTECPFCRQLNELLLMDDYYINNRDGRGGKTECKYGAALVHEIYYNGHYEGRTTYYTEPLNFCPVCGNKIGKE